MDMVKKTLYLRNGDYEFLSNNYSHTGLTAAQVIRHLVATHCDAILRNERGIDDLLEEVML